MKYDRFEQLPVWQAAMTLAEKVYALTDHRAFSRCRELKDQIRRAALSVSNNIAEGFERGTTAELLSFLYIARGSAGEVRSMLLFCQRLDGPLSEISNFKSQISELMSLAESCSRQSGQPKHLCRSYKTSAIWPENPRTGLPNEAITSRYLMSLRQTG